MTDRRIEIIPPSTATELAFSTRIQFFLLFLYFVLKPFYLWPAGQPQLADFVIVLLLLINVFSFTGKLSNEIVTIILTAGVLALYTAFVNLGWAGLRNDSRMAFIGIFYIFNFLIFFIFVNLGNRFGSEFYKCLMISIFVSVTLQFSLSFGFQNVGFTRQFIFFTNPNQLGYYALLSATMFAACSTIVSVRPIYQVAFYIFALYLAALSLSKATLVSFAFLLFLHFVKKPLHLLLLIACLTGFVVIGGELKFVQNAQNRIANIGQQSDDSAESRGYGRITAYPEYLILGAGERGLDRFPEEDHELHSTLATIFFSYGAVGSMLFLLLIFRIWSVSGTWAIVYVGPPILYGLTHQGFRFSLLWILLAVLAALPEAEAKPGVSALRR